MVILLSSMVWLMVSCGLKAARAVKGRAPARTAPTGIRLSRNRLIVSPLSIVFERLSIGLDFLRLRRTRRRTYHRPIGLGSKGSKPPGSTLNQALVASFPKVVRNEGRLRKERK